MAVLNPIRVRIVNFSNANLPNRLKVPDFPTEPERGGHMVAFGDVIFIEADDFKETAEKGFKRLTTTQSVGLKHIGCVLTLKDVVKGKSGRVQELAVEVSELSDTNKPKGFIHWVAQPIRCQVRLYDRLFKHKNPEDPNEVPGGFLTDCNPDSLHIISDALIDRSLANVRVYDRFQFERIGYFSVDSDSTPKLIVFNRTVLLKEDSSKAS